MPEAMRFVMLGAPTTHFVALSQAVLYRGAGISVVWPQLVSLGVIGAALFGYAWLRFRAAVGTMA